MALGGVCIYDLYDRFRQERRILLDDPFMLVPFLIGGAALDYGVQSILAVPLGDLSYINQETNGQFNPDQLLTNWPQFFGDFSEHLGWEFGLLIRAAIYFILTGRFRNDASLLLALSPGWLIAFVPTPTLSSILLMEYDGVRVMPPPSEERVGILGVFIAGLLWFRSHQLLSVAYVMTRGFLGGRNLIRFSTDDPVFPALSRSSVAFSE